MADTSKTEKKKTQIKKRCSRNTKTSKRGRKPQSMDLKSRKIAKNLTDKEYEEIFKAAINVFSVDKNDTADCAGIKLKKKSDLCERGSDDSDLPNYFDALDDHIHQNLCAHEDEKLQVVPVGEIDLFPFDNADEQGQKAAEVNQYDNNIANVAENIFLNNDLQCMQNVDHSTPDISDVEMQLSTFLSSPPKLPRKRIGLKKKRPALSRKQLKYNSDDAKSSSENLAVRSTPNEEETPQIKFTFGVWVECTKCKNWRFVESIRDAAQISDDWNCSMNKDFVNKCVEVKSSVLKKIGVGSVVLARIRGFPWWPAIVDNDPIENNFYLLDKSANLPTHYHVVFIADDASRAWVHKRDVKAFTVNETEKNVVLSKGYDYTKEIRSAEVNAAAAVQMDYNTRVEIFGNHSNSSENGGKTDCVEKNSPLEAPREMSSNSDEMKPVDVGCVKKRQRRTASKISGKKMKRDDVKVETKTKQEQDGKIAEIKPRVRGGRKVKPCLVKRQCGGNFEIISPCPQSQSPDVQSENGATPTEKNLDGFSKETAHPEEPIGIKRNKIAWDKEFDKIQMEDNDQDISSLGQKTSPLDEHKFLNLYDKYLQSQVNTEIVSKSSDIVDEIDNDSQPQLSSDPVYDNVFLTPKEDSQIDCDGGIIPTSQNIADDHYSSPFHLELSTDEFPASDIPPPLEIEE